MRKKKAKKKNNGNKEVENADLKEKECRKKTNGFCYWDEDILVLNVLGTPSAKRDVIGKPKGNQLKISVTASPKAGKATDYMVAFLAKEFGVKKTDIDVEFGQTNINKQLRIQSPQKLPTVIEQYLKNMAKS